MKIVLHGKLARMFGPEHYIETAVPADAIEGLSSQLPDWPRDMLIDVVDFESTDKLKAITATKEIHLVPAMVGGGGSLGRIALGAALIAVSFIPGLGTIGSVAISTVLFTAGVSMALSGIMMLFMKAPTVDKSEDPPPSKYFGVDRNTTEIGTYRALAYGRNIVPGHWLSIQVDAKWLVQGRFPA